MMKTSTHAVDFFQLPDLLQPKKQPLFSKWRTRLAAIGAQLRQALTADDSEPQVWQVRDRSGMPLWRSYDPITAQTYTFDAEDDACRWIEQRYNQSAN